MELILVVTMSFCMLCTSVADITEISSTDYKNQLSEDTFRFILFYSPWQKECQSKVDIVQKIAQRFDKNPDIIIGKGDIFNDRKLGHKLHIEDFCLFKFFVKGSLVPESYNGKHDVEDMTIFIKKKSNEEVQQGLYKRLLLELNSENFDRIVKDKKKDVMVYFYTTWCDKCKNLTKSIVKVAKAFKNEPNCVMAAINGEKNYDKTMQSRVGVYPTFVFFSKNNKDGEVYRPGKFDENWSELNMTKFLNVQCKTEREVDGSLGKMVGRIDELDRLARQFIQHSRRRERTIRETIERIQQLPPYKRKAADYYVKVMRRVQADGEEFLEKEVDRINKILIGNVQLEKQDELSKKRNILQFFRSNLRDEL